MLTIYELRNLGACYLLSALITEKRYELNPESAKYKEYLKLERWVNRNVPEGRVHDEGGN